MSGQLVEQWPMTTLGELCKVITKGTTPTSLGFQFEQEGINFVKIESITRGGSIIENKLAKVSQDCHDKLKRSQLQEGDILFSIAGALGRTTLVTKDILPANTNQALAIIRLIKSEDVLPEYVLKALSTGYTLSQIEKYRGGAAQQNLSLTQMKAFKIPLPPLEEQRRIVSILDEAFEQIDKNHQKINVKKRDIHDLFDSKTSEIFTDDSLRITTIDEICTIKGRIGYRGYKKSDLVNINEGAISLSPSNIISNRLDFVKCTYISWDKYFESPEIMVEKGDIVFCKTGSTIGKCAYINSLPEKTTLNPQLVVLKNIKLHSKYLYYFLSSKVFFQQLKPRIGGTATPTVSQKILGDCTIPIPSVKNVDSIVEQLDNLSVLLIGIDLILEKRQANLIELKQSILQEAFNGTL